MGVETKIQWTDHTFNPWRGCTKVSAGCANCYAEKQSRRNPSVLGEWGPKGRRAIAAESYWELPLRWDRAADAANERRRVFCASLADVFEDRPDLIAPRQRLLRTMHDTPHLDWLILTKRPGNVVRLIRGALDVDWPTRLTNGQRRDSAYWYAADWINGRPPANVWLGTSVEDQQWADERIPALLAIPAAVRFLSVEPLLGPIDLSRFLGFQHEDEIEVQNRDQSLPREQGIPFHDPWVHGIDWVIVGGESGPKARPCNIYWIRSIIDQCRSSGVACFVKQLGSEPYNMNWPVLTPRSEKRRVTKESSFGMIRDPKGGDPEEWPEDLRIREFPR